MLPEIVLRFRRAEEIRRLAHAFHPLGQQIPDASVGGGPFIEEHLAGGVAHQLVDQVGRGVRSRELRRQEFPGAEVREAGDAPLRRQVHGGQVIGLALLQHALFQHGAGGDDPQHIPLHQALGQSRVLHLLADGHLVALAQQLGHIALVGVVGHAAHGRLLLGRPGPVPGGEGQVQLPGGGAGILVEHLVEIAQAEKQDAVRQFILDPVILLHHGGAFCHYRSSSPVKTALRLQVVLSVIRAFRKEPMRDLSPSRWISRLWLLRAVSRPGLSPSPSMRMR